MINVIVAVADNGVIGGDNRLLWHISEDLKNFKRVTTGHPVIMGRKTFESLGKPLPNRENIVITRSDIEIDGCRVVRSLEEAIAGFSPSDNIFIIGGAQIYAAALPLADRLYITRVHHHYEGDVSFPEWSADEWECVERYSFERGEKFEYPFTIEEYRRVARRGASTCIAQITPKEISIIREVAIPSFEATYKNIVSKEQNDYMLDMMYSESSLKGQFEEGQQFYLFYENGKAIGYLSLNPEAESLVHLEKLYFLPDMQGKGYGRLLIEHGFREAKRLCGGRAMTLELNANRANSAVGFYKNMGMTIARQGDYKIEGTDYIRPDYIFSIDL